MWRVFDAYWGKVVYQSDYVEDCANWVSSKEQLERYHIVGGINAPVWNVDGGLDDLAKLDVEMFMDEIEEEEVAPLTLKQVKENQEFITELTGRYKKIIESDLNNNCAYNFGIALRETINSRKSI